MSETCRDMTKMIIRKINQGVNSSWMLAWSQHPVIVKKLFVLQGMAS